MSLEEKKSQLKKIIEEEVFITAKQGSSFTESGLQNDWIFDFKRVLLRVEVLNLISDIFWNIFSNREPFQLGCLETTGISMVTSIAQKKFLSDKTKINSFFIRKSRKRDGFLRMVEGCELTDDLIILVDDSMNSGQSFVRQVEVLESFGKKVVEVFVVTRFRDQEYYSYLLNKGIKITCLFELNDFKSTLGVHNQVSTTNKRVDSPFKVQWLFKAKDPAYFLVNPKSAPFLSEGILYFGTDSGRFFAIDSTTGGELWNYRVLSGAFGPNKKGKHILSSPVVFENKVFFGAYDGNLYALNNKTGKKEWVNLDADWIGSSPCISESLELLFVGMEFGIKGRQGGVAGVDIKSGDTKWLFKVETFVHSSPKYSEKNNIVVCGSEQGLVFGLNAKNGKLLWELKTGGPVKAGFSMTEDEALIAFGSYDTHIYVVDIKNGNVIQRWETGNNIYSEPLFYKDYLYMGCTDKMVYCFNYKTGDRVWEYLTRGRIFASPIIVEGKLYIGSNDCMFYEFDYDTGKVTGIFQSVERIVNKAIFDVESKNFYLPTVANEIYKLVKK